MDRRTLLTTLALLPVAGCATAPAPAAAPSAPATPAALPTGGLVALEERFGARLGVYARDTGTGAELAHRADERFAFCSTFKALATAALLRDRPLPALDAVVRYGESDLLKSAVVTREHVAEGLPVRALLDAAVRYSDGTAGNLLLRELGGPAALTAFARSVGDEVTRMDRIEPDIVEATPGDPRDTSSPRALGTTFDRLVLGDALPPDRREILTDLLRRNTTGDARIRAGLPAGWTVADKTGTGDYGTLNDIAVTWPPGRAPVVVAIMSSKDQQDAPYDQALLAEAATVVADVLSGAR